MTAAPHRTARQRGAASLVFMLGLFLAMALATLAIHRNLVFAQRTSAHQARATQAYEAAEAGTEWALAQLNSTRPIGADCLPSDAPGALAFRDRFLQLDAANARVTPITAAAALCVHGAAGWSCGCTGDGVADIAALPVGQALAPAFALRFVADQHAGVVRVVSSGCTSLAGACLPGSSAAPDGTAQVNVALALYSALRRPPQNALTTPSNPAPGLNAAQFFASIFGLDKATWARQPVITTVACPADCTGAIADAIAAGTSLFWVDGDLTLSTPAQLGSATRPVLIVAGGRVRIDSGVNIVGALYAGAMEFDGGTLQGAAVSETAFSGLPAARFNADVLALLARGQGSFVRVAGSWRDF